MDLIKEDVHRSLHQHMDELLKERNEIYQQHQQELEKCKENLQRLEQELTRRKEEVEQEEKELLVIQKSLKLEKEDIVRRQEEIREHRIRIEQELEYICRDITASGKKESVEPEIKKEEQEEHREKEEPEKQETEEHPGGEYVQHPGLLPVERVHEEIPDILRRFAVTAESIFPAGEVLEHTPQSYCMKIGDKELRILMGTPPVAEILAKREKNMYLMKGISQLNQVQSDWEFSYQDNHLKCIMPFTEAIPAETVLGKCEEAIAKYFK